MVLGIGIDIVENERVKKLLNNDFTKKILTKKEFFLFSNLPGKKQLLFLCGRFAAKEAVIKALSNFEDLNMLDIEILNNSLGKPIVNCNNHNILLSISHENKYTIAEAILIK